MSRAMLGCMLISVWLLASGQDPSLLSLVSKRPLCVVHDSTAPEAELTETLLEAIQALRFDFTVSIFDVAWSSEDDDAASFLRKVCGQCSDRLVIARTESLYGLMPLMAHAWQPDCAPPAVRSVLFPTDFLDGVEPSPCLGGDGHCLLDYSVIRLSDGPKLFYDAVISLSANSTVLNELSQKILAHGLTPWQLHTGDSRMLESEADLGMLFQRVFPPPIPRGGFTLGPATSAPLAAWSSWQCHSAGTAGYDVPENGRAGSEEFCLLERVSCCTGSDFTFHASSVESPNLPPARFVSQCHPNISIAVRPSQAPYVVPNCHLHAPVAYLWGHGWEANPGHLLHDTVRPQNHTASPACAVPGTCAWVT
jgi:hypothetical protein